MIEETEHQWECQKAACFILRTGYLGQDSWENEKKNCLCITADQAVRPPKGPRGLSGLRLDLGLVLLANQAWPGVTPVLAALR